MYRLGVVSNTFKKASDATLDRSKGQLMRVNTSGQATHVLGEGNLIHLPLIEDFVAAEHGAASPLALLRHPLSALAIANIIATGQSYLEISDLYSSQPVCLGVFCVGID